MNFTRTGKQNNKRRYEYEKRTIWANEFKLCYWR